MGAEAQARRAVLDRGNVWVAGIPGLGDGGAALFGEYRLDLPAGEQRCRVWLTGETPSFTGGGWRPRSQIAGVPVFQRQEGEDLLAGCGFDGGTGLGSWTVVFRFPPGPAAGLDDPGINALIGRWLDRFRYFLSLIKSPADMSFPAVVAF
jgi:hypothetical protein